MDLRDYQHKGHDAILADLQTAQSALLVLATGLGKTIVFSHVAKDFITRGRVLILAHREELIRQAAEKISIITGTYPDIEMADEWADKPSMIDSVSKVIVSSVQTQVAGRKGRGRMSRFTPADFSLLIIDEAHHATSKSYRKIINYYKQNQNLKVLGVTATPDRTDKAALGQIFEKVSFVFDINDGIDNGWLVPIVQRSVLVKGLDFSSVKTTAGDLNGADLAAVMEYEANLHAIADPTFQLAGNKKTLIFASSVAHAERLCEILNRHRENCARFACAKTDDETRKQILKDYRAGEFQFLVNVGLYTEGWDEPSVEMIVIARPTKSRSLFCQMIGRGSRTLTGTIDFILNSDDRKAAIALSLKPTLQVLDFVGNAGRHKLVNCLNVLGGNYSEAVIDLAIKMAQKTDAPKDPRKMLKAAEEELKRRAAEMEARRKSEAANRMKLLAKAEYSTHVVNAFDVLDLEPARGQGWDKRKPATNKQIEFLRKQGVDNASELSMGDAGRLCSEFMKRWKEKKCTFKQARLLHKHGYPGNLTFDEARKTIDALAANNWNRPSEVKMVEGVI